MWIGCYPSLQDIKGPVDLVVIAVPARITPRVFEDIAAKGTKAAIVISGGFSETGPRGGDAWKYAVHVKGLEASGF